MGKRRREEASCLPRKLMMWAVWHMLFYLPDTKACARIAYMCGSLSWSPRSRLSPGYLCQSLYAFSLQISKDLNSISLPCFLTSSLYGPYYLKYTKKACCALCFSKTNSLLEIRSRSRNLVLSNRLRIWWNLVTAWHIERTVEFWKYAVGQGRIESGPHVPS